jgi:hypothetical protein
MRPGPGGVEILPHSTTAGSQAAPVRMLYAGEGSLLVGVGRDQAGVHRKSFAADKSFLDTAADYCLKDMPEHITVSKAPMPVLREGGVIRHMAVQTEPAKPAIGQVEMHLFAQPPLRADAKAVTNDQHPDHQLGIDRGAADRAVEGRQMPSQIIEIKETVDSAQHVIDGDVDRPTETDRKGSPASPADRQALTQPPDSRKHK